MLAQVRTCLLCELNSSGDTHISEIDGFEKRPNPELTESKRRQHYATGSRFWGNPRNAVAPHRREVGPRRVDGAAYLRANLVHLGTWENSLDLFFQDSNDGTERL